MKNLVILGGGGHGRELFDLAESISNADLLAKGQIKYTILGFLDEKGITDSDPITSLPVQVIGNTDSLIELETEYIIGVGSGKHRERIAESINHMGKTAAKLIHPSAFVSLNSYLGEGVAIFAGSRISTNSKLGNHTHINFNCTISHDCKLGDYVTLSPGVNLAGDVEVGNGTTFGTGAVVLPGISIGANVVVGAGAVVIRDVFDGQTVAGVPARSIDSN